MKQKFNVITSSCIPLPLENVDTDQIIPARFLKAIDKEVWATTSSATGATMPTELQSQTS